MPADAAVPRASMRPSDIVAVPAPPTTAQPGRARRARTSASLAKDAVSLFVDNLTRLADGRFRRVV